MRSLLAAVLLAVPLLACAADHAAVERYTQALAATLSAQERDVLARIPDASRRLLAARAYVRSGAQLNARWSWTDEQIRTYEQSSEYARLIDDIGAITREFERRNPGYTLYANTQVRSLDTQIERWNSNPRVGKTAATLYSAVQSALGAESKSPRGESLARFKEFLQQWRPSPAAPLAAPGLSLHGQLRAIDFQIMKNGAIVAATEVDAVAKQWEASGWSRRLKEAVNAATPRFKGPLEAPNEPWHYEYRAVPSE